MAHGGCATPLWHLFTHALVRQSHDQPGLLFVAYVRIRPPAAQKTQLNTNYHELYPGFYGRKLKATKPPRTRF